MTTNLFSMFGTDKSMETEGVWLYPAGEGEGAPKFKVARTGGLNTKFDQLQTKFLKPYQRLIKANASAMTPEVLEIIKAATLKSFVGACLLGWENVISVEGNELPFSQENATMLLTKLPDLYNELLGRAQEISTFQREGIEDEVKN